MRCFGLSCCHTDRDKIEAIVEPAVSRPLAAEWEAAKAAAGAARAGRARGAAARARAREAALAPLRAFLDRLGRFTVLDPACGSGNFLYLALGALKDLEHRARLEAEAMGLERGFPAVGPANLRGIEIDPYAAELARVSVWIGEIQWLRRNNLGLPRDPVLRPLETIECRDAILSPDGGEPDWPEADVVIGNPPFLGTKPMLSVLGDDYTRRLRAAYKGRVPAFADLVCYWFHKAGKLVADGKIARAGLVATNSIRGGRNRAVLDRIVADAAIFDAWSDEPWVIDGANVRVSLVCFAPRDAGLPVRLDGESAPRINADLSGGAIDLARASRLPRNSNIAFMGNLKNGPFDISGDLAREWLRLPANPNGRPNSDVLKPWINGMSLTRRSADKWIVDFGPSMSEADAALYEAPFTYIAERVKPVRRRNRDPKLRDFWWRHERPRPEMWRALEGLSRYIATPTMSKHRIFVWLDFPVCPDKQLIAIARDDDATFGVLHSRFHEAWSLRLGTSLEDRPRYTPTTTFETFPFPPGLSPDVPAAARAADPRGGAIARAARRLSDLRESWLNPPEWVEWQEEPAPGYPPRPTPRDAPAANAARARTLTALYNAKPQWLADAHDALDEAVAAAYGWDTDISEQDALEALLEMNSGEG